MKHKPGIAFDSAVCINAGNGRYPHSEWRAVWKFVANNFHYAIVPLILTEIILGIAHGDDAHFEDNKKSLAILYPTHPTRFLDMPGLFVVRTVLRRRPHGDFPSPASFKFEARIMMRASSKADLRSGSVRMPESQKYSRGLDLGLLIGQMDKGRKQHVDTLNQLRIGTLAAPPAEEWARLWMLSLGITATPEECARVAAALDAAYRYECFLWNEAATGQYKFANHASDWIDSQLLYYLCDREMHLVVDDAQLKNRIAGSPQSDRVVTYTEFVKIATGHVPWRWRAPRKSAAAGHS
jgi:hypothetical protein